MALSQEDQQAVQQLIADATKGVVQQLESRLAPIVQQVEQFGTKVTEAVKKAETMGEEAIKKIANQVLGEGLSARDKAAQDAAAKAAADKTVSDAREKFIADNAAKLPEAYRKLIPVSDKPEDLQAGLKVATDALQKDLTALGITPPSLGASAAAKPAEQQAVTKSDAELAKMSGSERRAFMAQAAQTAVTPQ